MYTFNYKSNILSCAGSTTCLFPSIVKSAVYVFPSLYILIESVSASIMELKESLRSKRCEESVFISKTEF